MTEQDKKNGRIERAKNQKIYLMKAKREDDEKWEFLVKGS